MIDLEDELHNWVRTVRSGRIRHQAGSAEGQYRPALGDIELEGMEEPPPSTTPVDVRRGWRVELAWRSIPSVRTRLLVSWHYIKNRPLPEAARKARMPNRQAESELTSARAQIRLRLLTFQRQ